GQRRGDHVVQPPGEQEHRVVRGAGLVKRRVTERFHGNDPHMAGPAAAPASAHSARPAWDVSRCEFIVEYGSGGVDLTQLVPGCGVPRPPGTVPKPPVRAQTAHKDTEVP